MGLVTFHVWWWNRFLSCIVGIFWLQCHGRSLALWSGIDDKMPIADNDKIGMAGHDGWIVWRSNRWYKFRRKTTMGEQGLWMMQGEENISINHKTCITKYWPVCKMPTMKVTNKDKIGTAGWIDVQSTEGNGGSHVVEMWVAINNVVLEVDREWRWEADQRVCWCINGSKAMENLGQGGRTISKVFDKAKGHQKRDNDGQAMAWWREEMRKSALLERLLEDVAREEEIGWLLGSGDRW